LGKGKKFKMKTKELIRQLQEADPSGEEECTIYGEDIVFVSPEPAYWDGCYTTFTGHAGSGKIKIHANGNKIRIHTYGYEDALLDNPETVVEYDSEYAKERMEKHIEKCREECKRIDADIEEWAKTLPKNQGKV
jgi:hypothetical protein